MYLWDVQRVLPRAAAIQRCLSAFNSHCALLEKVSMVLVGKFVDTGVDIVISYILPWLGEEYSGRQAFCHLGARFLQ